MWLGSCGTIRGEGHWRMRFWRIIIRCTLYTLRKIHQHALLCSMSGQNIEKDQTVVFTGVQGAFHRILLEKQSVPNIYRPLPRHGSASSPNASHRPRDLPSSCINQPSTNNLTIWQQSTIYRISFPFCLSPSALFCHYTTGFACNATDWLYDEPSRCLRV
jgi:hypothetical protein